MAESTFDYGRAFSRNLGWVTETEQAVLQSKTVAIAGMGGVGGHHLLAHVRLGISRFRIADFDQFELANFNRQAGASMPTLNAEKADTLANLARQINPEAVIDVYHDGISLSNIDAFLKDVDIYVDGIDFFAFDIREALFSACYRLGIPAVTAAPLGMGAALLVFMPGKMSFDDYFRWTNCSDTEKAVRFIAGLAPSMLHDYLVDESRVDLWGKTGPSTAIACYLCAGIAAAESLKILLGRGPVICAPRGRHFDAYKGKLVTTWRPWGNAHPLQRALIAVGMRRFS